MDLKLQNVFAALDGKKKSKKASVLWATGGYPLSRPPTLPLTRWRAAPPAQEGSEKKSSAGSKRPGKKVALDETLWQKTQISVSWADCDDEDDDEDAAAAAAPPPVETGVQRAAWDPAWRPGACLRDADACCLSDAAKADDPQDADSNDGDNASDGAPEDEHEHEAEEESLVPAEAPAPGPKAGKAAEPDRQLSKKELKKKELDDMDAILAELGIQVAPSANGGAAGAEAGLSKTAQRKLKKQQQVRMPCAHARRMARVLTRYRNAVWQASQPDGAAPDVADSAPPMDAGDAEVNGTSGVAVDALEVKRRIAAASTKAKPGKSSAAATALAEAKARAEKAKKSSDKKAQYDR